MFLVVVAAIFFPGQTVAYAAEPRAVLAPVEPTRCAAPFALPAPDGGSRSLAAERGRPIIVHFFATWCEPCRAELATLQQLFERRGRQVSVLGVNVGEVPGRVRRFLQDNPVSFPVVLDEDRAVTKSWAVDGLPTSVVLDKDLIPRLAVTGDLDWAADAVGAEIDRVAAAAPDPQPTRSNCKRKREDNQ